MTDKNLAQLMFGEDQEVGISLPIGKKAGIEIELEFPGGSYLDPIDEDSSFCEVFHEVFNVLPMTHKKDGSLRGPSVELVSYKPAGRSQVQEIINTYFYKFLPALDFQPLWNTGRCSTHFHFNALSFTPEELYKRVTLYYLVEEVLMDLVDPDRKYTNFAVRFKSDPLVANTLRQWNEGIEPLKDLKEDRYKYSNLNLTKLCSLGSLEVRTFGPAKDYDKLSKWFNVNWSLIYYAKADLFNSPVDIIDKYYSMGQEEFMKYCMPEYILNTIPGIVDKPEVEINASLLYAILNQ